MGVVTAVIFRVGKAVGSKQIVLKGWTGLAEVVNKTEKVAENGRMKCIRKTSTPFGDSKRMLVKRLPVVRRLIGETMGVHDWWKKIARFLLFLGDFARNGESPR